MISAYVTKTVFMTLLFTSSVFFIPKALRKKDEDKKIDAINTQFRDALNAIMSSLKSGLSMNSAIIKTPEDLEKIHANYKDKIILLEFIKMRHDLNMGIPLDQVLTAFKERLRFEEVNDFVSSIIILKKKGGNLVEVMENTISMISPLFISPIRIQGSTMVSLVIHLKSESKNGVESILLIRKPQPEMNLTRNA